MKTSNDQHIKAFCYLYKEGDERNKCLLTDTRFIVIYKGKRHIFDLGNISQITFNSRKLMLPLLAGGVLAPLSIISIFKNLYDPWLILLILFASLFLFYFGWIGQKVMTIQENVQTSDFGVTNISLNLKAFARFVNDILSNKGRDEPSFLIYHITTRKQWEAYSEDKTYTPPSLRKEGFIHCYRWEQLKQVKRKYFENEKELLLLLIDAFKVKSEIKFEDVYNSGKLYPHIYGNLNLDAVVKIKQLWKEDGI